MSSTYVDGSTPLDAAHMNALQQKVEKGLANGYLGLDGSGNVALAAAARVVWAGDTNVYRLAAGAVVTDGEFHARQGGAGQVGVGTSATAATILFGSAGDTNLYRSAAGVLKTDGPFYAGSFVQGAQGLAGQVYIGAGGPSGAAGIVMGSNADTNLYRSGVNRLRTDGDFVIGGQLWTGTAVAGATGGIINWKLPVYRASDSAFLGYA